jgi:RHS repeat-associated protein
MELQSNEFSDGMGLEMYEYRYRFYDHQIGRFISQDRLADKYPHYAPYQFAGNQVPNAIDLDGLEEFRVNQRDGYKDVTLVRVDAPFSVQYNGQKLDAFPQKNMNAYYQNNVITKSEVDSKGNSRVSSLTTFDDEGNKLNTFYDNQEGSKEIALNQDFGPQFANEPELTFTDVAAPGTAGATLLQNNNLESNTQNTLTTGIPIGTDLLSFNASSMGSPTPATFTITNTNANGTSTGVGPYVINGGTGVGSPAMISVVPGTFLNIAVSPGAGGGNFKFDFKVVDTTKPVVQKLPIQ